jgi:hypothetical protein
MSLLWVADSFYVGVRDIAAATSWYIEKFGLRRASVELDEGEGCIGLIFPKETPSRNCSWPVGRALGWKHPDALYGRYQEGQRMVEFPRCNCRSHRKGPTGHAIFRGAGSGRKRDRGRGGAVGVARMPTVILPAILMAEATPLWASRTADRTPPSDPPRWPELRASQCRCAA